VLYVVCLAAPRAGTPLILPSMRDRSDYPSRYRGIVAETEQETDIVAEEPSYHCQRGNSSSGSTSSSTESRMNISPSTST
jgi:hypothetical protein